MTKIKTNFKYIYSTIINSFVTVTAIPFPLRSTFTTDIHLKYMQKTGKRVVKMIIISMKNALLPYKMTATWAMQVGVAIFVYTVRSHQLAT